MRTSYKQGSAVELIIIGILVLAVAGLLVWKFVGGTSKSTDATSSSSTKSSSSSSSTDGAAVTLINGSINSSFGTMLNFKYPSTWEYGQVTNGVIGPTSAGQQIISIASPSAKYTVRYDIGSQGGIGGACSPEDTGTIASIAYQDLTNFAGMSYTEITYGGKMPENTVGSMAALGSVGLMDASTAHSVKVGDSLCDLAFSGVKLLREENAVNMLGAELTIEGVSTVDQFKMALSGAEYEQAKAILLSTTH